MGVAELLPGTFTCGFEVRGFGHRKTFARARVIEIIEVASGDHR